MTKIATATYCRLTHATVMKRHEQQTSTKIILVQRNSVEADEMPHFVTFCLGRHVFMKNTPLF